MAFKVKGWQASLKALPGDVKELHQVKVEAVFPTNSTMLIVSISVSIQLLLPKNPAYTFLGCVKGTSLVPAKPLPPASRSSTETGLPKRTDSDEITFGTKEEADIVPLHIANIVEFFEATKSHPYMQEKRSGKFSQMATKIGLHTKSEPDSRLEAIRHIVQKLILVRNEDGEYTNMSYDLQLTELTQMFELTKKFFKDTIYKVNPKNNELAATITEFEQLESKALTRLEAEKRMKPEYAKLDAIVPKDRELDSGMTTIPRTDSGTPSKKAARTISMLSAMRPKACRRKSSSMSVKEINGSQTPKSLSFTSFALVAT
ncbi:hypothetical protein DL98DRAFT_581958 [Cadophora sp. DSE1049]|nr:hypothetical protein DL98DRAFT_581958 [Cadophora sp. DSE1049]